MKQEWIAGKNPVLEALRARHPLNKLWIAKESKGAGLTELIRQAKEQGVVVQQVPRKKIDQVTGEMAHQGVLAFVAAYTYAELDTLFKRAAERNEPPFFLILDGIEDPHNLGSILRTADATGAHGVIIPKRRSAGLTATVAKTSAGAIHYVPVTRVTNLAQTIEELKTRHIWVCGTAADAQQDFRQADFTVPVAVVIGNEGKGISRLVREKCDYHVKIPLAGRVSSLNASVAASVLMFEVYRQRHPVS
ncbi:RNA methyltransferase, TrmH family, group 3 [Caldalkalibacillus thermarum TA2.A1]|uniref:23S rRNA (Guanosine(2251)-2'-O)-methyltransferase RlmB n=1 Tax=Caldalkalibacillus thermarum (strain TA2.A1) TaxID=986075 RepID=F5L3Z7_CALTT|nr:23S rRNA (guanosine(2251)-2'-O)-methyltransferase RlmB [Caldalkalibacillus thermarum]EGL83939.1 RNA methyltransferase, TrmH family, group 3 [Caldalkalibacillus thermarum TA2.A1]QZT34400.1 23S rRNA (guanosine(2251)-2'-O)-methyltransferase RlmB [Caldalkalibacillus thermarum TA2.A1]